MDVSKAMAGYLVRILKAEAFGGVDPDRYYRYDQSRPWVKITGGVMEQIHSPEGVFYGAHTAAGQRDVVILKAEEPHLRWLEFCRGLYELCDALQIDTVITLGSMFDQVLHTDRIISAIVSDDRLQADLTANNVTAVNYEGPSAIHSVIQYEGTRRGLRCLSLWSHCPHYLSGATHYGLLAHLAGVLARVGEFKMDTRELETAWKALSEQIQQAVETSPELQAVVAELRRAKVRGSFANLRSTGQSDEKIINLKDFLDPS
jgi:proteasome assembly chaperone (PAC2) family protein